MRILLFFAISVFGFFLFTPTLQAQEDAKQLTALQLEGDLSKSLQRVVIATFKVNEKGILRPKKGYSLYYSEGKKSFYLLPAKQSLKFFNNIKGYESVPLPNGAGESVCSCYGDTSDLCEFVYDESGSSPHQLNYVCTGETCCVAYTLIDFSKEVRGFETPGGGWFNF